MLWNPTGVRSLYFLACCALGVTADGSWQEWGAWGTCSESCGQGMRQRIRNCDPSPEGKFCRGKLQETEACHVGAQCSVDGGWSNWSVWTACSVSCGEGSMQRFRSCSNPFPMHGGMDCVGPPLEQQQCFAIKVCPRDGQWSKWSQWSQCSVTCGAGGSEERYRSCNNPPPVAEGRYCEGRARRTRACKAPSNCPVNGQWSEWSEWTACSVTCGSGERQRHRGCDHPAPSHGGLDCDRKGAAELQSHTCTGLVEHCPVDGGWSKWSEWGSCNTPQCNVENALSFRQRSCNSPLPEHGGAMCQGTFLESGLCGDPVNCAVDGGWSEWSLWDCSKFHVKRDRKCDNPKPINGGAKCKGKAVEFYPKGDKSFGEKCPQFSNGDEDQEQGSGREFFGSGDGFDDEE